MTGSHVEEAQDSLVQDAQTSKIGEEEKTPGKDLPAAARRALMEAEQRRAQAEKEHAAREVNEIGGAKGPEPTRYGDWEKNGILSDF